ncbi:hypothetical protein [Parabacteroides sp. Marseille-P3160]|uniref:hypothetical protein n=1 Tax=Parabacteroides sp. Marseille-P3160 TaxID=1917887 RepID=UPI001359D13C|nr:hypothetical protein [Parabacteroides sp. Marseille-P3160]
MTQEEIQEFTDWKLAKKQQEEAEAARKAAEDAISVEDWTKRFNEYGEVFGKLSLEEE